MSVVTTCPKCHGKSFKPAKGGLKPCPKCCGTGYVDSKGKAAYAYGYR